MHGQDDLLIKNAQIIDGTGAAPKFGDVAVRGDTISALGPINSGFKAADIIDAGGRSLAPGFIDSHVHGDPINDNYEGYLGMGVTTLVLGQDGASPGDEWDSPLPKPRSMDVWVRAFRQAGSQLNVVPFSGHGTVRHLAGIDDGTRTPSSAQQQRMNAILASDMEAGSFGLTTGLEYVPGIYSSREELRSLAEVVSRRDGCILSHLRTEDDGKIQGAIQEFIDSGGNARLQISHLKVVYGKGAETARELLAFIARERSAGVKLTADIYPYYAGYGSISLLFPEWALPPSDYAAIMRSRRAELADYLRKRMLRRGGPAALLFGSKPYAGQTLEQVARQQQTAFEEVLMALGPNGADAANFVMDPQLQDILITSPITSISTDGAPGLRHPRATGTYARVIEEFVVKRGALTIQEAVRKCTGLPASVLGLVDRGTVRAGAKADLVIFDPAGVRARSSFTDPFALAEGFDVVLVNGKIARANGKLSSTRYGRLILRT